MCVESPHHLSPKSKHSCWSSSVVKFPQVSLLLQSFSRVSCRQWVADFIVWYECSPSPDHVWITTASVHFDCDPVFLWRPPRYGAATPIPSCSPEVTVPIPPQPSLHTHEGGLYLVGAFKTRISKEALSMGARWASDKASSVSRPSQVTPLVWVIARVSITPMSMSRPIRVSVHGITSQSASKIKAQTFNVQVWSNHI